MNNNLVKYILTSLVVLLFCCAPQPVFALEQLQNYNFDGNTTNWKTVAKINGAGSNTAFGYNTNDLRIQQGNQNNRRYEGIVYQGFRTPANPINVRFGWSYYFTNTGQTNDRDFYFCYDTGSTNENGILLTDHITADTAGSLANPVTGEKLVNGLSANTDYYAKIYAKATTKNTYIRRFIQYYSVNFSPSNLRITENYNNGIITGKQVYSGLTLNWDTSTGRSTLKNYKAYRSTTAGGPYTAIYTTPNATTRTYNDNITTAGTYYYAITDTDTNNRESPYSVEASFDVPSPIQNFNAVVTSENGWSRVKFSFNPIAGYTGQYVVARKATAAGAYTNLLYQNHDLINNFNDYDTLTEGNTYYYTATYRYKSNSDDAHYAPISNEISLYYLLPPTGFKAGIGVNLANDATEANLSWDTKAVAGLQNYKVYRSTTENGTYNLVGTIPAGTTTFTDTGLTPGQVYYYRLTCSTNKGESGYSQIRASMNPTNLRGEYRAGNQAYIEWNAPNPQNENHGGYRIFRGNTKTSLTQIADWHTPLNYTDSIALGDGDAVYYAVKEMGYDHESGYSNVFSIANIKPPTNLTADMAITLTWTPSITTTAKVAGYNIYRSLTNGGPYTKIAEVGKVTSYEDTTAETGITYYYVLKTRNANGAESPASNQTSYKIPEVPIPVLRGSAQPGLAASLEWDSVTYPHAYLEGYRLYRSTTHGGPYTEVAALNKTTLEYLDTGLTADQEYFYVLKAFNTRNKDSDYSNEVKILVGKDIKLSVHINDASIIPEVTVPVKSIPVSWTIEAQMAGLTITGYNVKIEKLSGGTVKTINVTSSSATSATVPDVMFQSGESYLAYVEVRYTMNGGPEATESFPSQESFTAIIPGAMPVKDGWNGKDISYSLFDDRVEACWELENNPLIVRYEACVGTSLYGNDVADWRDIGMVDRVAITGVSLASGTTYYTSVRGISQGKNIVVNGCTDGFICIKTPVKVDTDGAQFFNNGRVIENLSTNGGKLSPIDMASAGGGYWKSVKPITITEPGVTDRVNAPCLVSFNIPNNRPTNIREFRVTDESGKEVPFSCVNNSTSDPQIVLLVNMRKNETKTYYVYWGNPSATAIDYGFVTTNDKAKRNKTSADTWTIYYSRLNLPAGFDTYTSNSPLYNGTTTNYDDYSKAFNSASHLSKFKFFGVNRNGNWYASTNGTLTKNSFTTYTNSWSTFTSGSSSMGYCITPIWNDLYVGTSWNESGVFWDKLDNPKRIVVTWIVYRYQVLDDAYKVQAVLYETGDIALRYNLLNPRALVAGGSTDKAVNTNQNTVGISNCDGINYLFHTPLQIGINQQPTAMYQCRDAFEDTTVYGPITNNNETAHFESMVFDTRMASPKWDHLEYDVTTGAGSSINISYRTGSTPLPEMGGWTGWQGATDVTANGQLNINTQGRYIQYKALFKRNTNVAMSLNEVRFVYGGISIEEITAEKDGQPVTEVTQGETNIPVKMTIKNDFDETINLTVATLTFSLGGHSAAMVGSLPAIAAGETATLDFLVNIANDAPSGECTLDGLATGTYNTIKYSDDSAQTPLTWTVKSKAKIVIDNVTSEKTTVTKGQTGLPMSIQISNLGETDCKLENISLTKNIGIYTFNYVGPEFGTTIIPANGTIMATYTVNINRNSESGSDDIGATASATNVLSGELIEVFTTDNPHTWMIQNPAELTITEIVASDTVYRGQKNNTIIVRAQNTGEAEMEWFTSETSLSFTEVSGPPKFYENIRKETEEDSIKLLGNEMSNALFMVDIKADTATGTDDINASGKGQEKNTMNDLECTGALVPGRWTIYSERVNTYRDAGHLHESNSFNKPDGTDVLSVFIKADHLASTEEYVIYCIAPDGTEIARTQPRSADLERSLYYELDFLASCQGGIYTIKVTDPLDTYVCCQNTFEIVQEASMTASFTIPLYVTVNQNFVASFTYINEGGAVIESATLNSTVSIQGPGTADLTLNPDGSQFSPKMTNVPGYGQATATYKFKATGPGNFRLTNTATGYDSNSNKTLKVENVQSNLCVIQTAPNITVTLNALPVSNVFLNQKNLIITARITNNGQATAVFETASFTYDIGGYSQELVAQEVPFEIPGGTYKDLTFNVAVNKDSPSGNDTLQIKTTWYDKNWPESGIKEGNSNTRNWEIMPIGIILSSDDDFNTTQENFSPGQNVNVKVYGITPNHQYYRIRFYQSKIAVTTYVPTGYVSANQGSSGLLASDDKGDVYHTYKLPAGTYIGDWSVTIEYAGDSPTTALSKCGEMKALQYFKVLNAPNITATIDIDQSKEIFVGDDFEVTMTVKSTIANTASVVNISPATLIQSGTAGKAILVSGPDPATFTLKAQETKTFKYVYNAIEDTGDTAVAANRFKLTNAATGAETYAAKGMNENLWTDIVTNSATSNGIVIYSEAIGVTPNPVEFGHTVTYDAFGHMICGETKTENNFTVLKVGNYPAKNIRLNSADFNGPSGARISRANLSINPQVITTLTADTTVPATLFIPHNQETGLYSTTMFVYSDVNDNRVFDNGEIIASFKSSVFVDPCWLLTAVEKETNMGSWPKGAIGCETPKFTVNFFNSGNQPLSNVKIKEIPEVKRVSPSPGPSNLQFKVSQSLFGAMAVKEYRSVEIFADTTTENITGTYIATFTIWDDMNGNGIIEQKPAGYTPTSAEEVIEFESDTVATFQMIISIGDLSYTIAPNNIKLQDVETSSVAISGSYPGFNNLTVTNTGELDITRLKLQVGDGSDRAIKHVNGIDAMPASCLIITENTLDEPVEVGQNDTFSLTFYTPASTPMGTYTAELFFYSDDNSDDRLDAHEYKQSVTFTVTVKETKKVLVTQKTVLLGGASKGTEKIQGFSCRNVGNVPLTKLYIKFENLVHNTDNTKVIGAGQLSFVEIDEGGLPHTIEYIQSLTPGEFFTPHVKLVVPNDTEDGVYITSKNCIIFEDEDGNKVFATDDSEICDQFKLMIEVGELDLDVLQDKIYSKGEPSQKSSLATMEIKNIKTLDIVNVVATSTELVHDGGLHTPIPANCSVFEPKSISSLLKDQIKGMNWAVNVPASQMPGTYSCTLTIWGDGNRNGQLEDPGEASDTVKAFLHVEESVKVEVVQDTVNLVDAISANSFSDAIVEYRNTGNVHISPAVGTIRCQIGALYLGSSFIATDSISCQLQATALDVLDSALATFTVTLGATVPSSGTYQGKQKIYVDLNGNNLWDLDEPFDDLTLRAVVGEKSISFNPSPLDFGILDIDSISDATVKVSNEGIKLKSLRAYCKSHCDCGCSDTEITLKSPTDAVSLDSGKNLDYVFQAKVGKTKPGTHTEIWTFYDDSNNNGIFDSDREYSKELTITYTVAEYKEFELIPNPISINMKPGETATFTVNVHNLGNTPLSPANLSWNFVDITDAATGTSKILDSAFSIVSIPATDIEPDQTLSYELSIKIPFTQPVAPYKTEVSGICPSLTDISAAGNTVELVITINVTKSDGAISPPSTIHQVIASDTFQDVSMPYFLSAWVCAGRGYNDATFANLSYANLSLVRYDQVGIPIAALTVRLDNRDNKLEANGLGATSFNLFEDQYPDIGTNTAKLDFHRVNGQPVIGISGDPVFAKDANNEFAEPLRFYRIYFAIDVKDYDPATCNDTFRIMLTNTVDSNNTASSSVFFDGVKFEKAFDPTQTKPTTYHDTTTLISPSKSIDMSGKFYRYEW